MHKAKHTLYIFLTLFFLLNLNLVLGISNAKNNLEEYFRLHVVANSDSISDQTLKLKVTDNVNNYINSITNDITNKDEYIAVIKSNMYEILKVAQNTLNSNDSKYPVTAYLGNIKYDEKTYNNYTMQAGTYNSLKIVIGNGNGENWWSLLYPSLPNNLTIEDALSNDEIKFESKIIEWFNEIF